MDDFISMVFAKADIILKSKDIEKKYDLTEYKVNGNKKNNPYLRPGDILQFHFEQSALNIWPVKVKNQLLKEVAQLKLELGQSQLT